nr:MAG TPA: Thioredoxin signature protein-LIKE DOMAIN, ALPHA-BETA PROTEIN, OXIDOREDUCTASE.62A [Caudoviricetes sp.]
MKIKKMIYLFLLAIIICLIISLLWLFRNPSYEKIDKALKKEG